MKTIFTKYRFFILILLLISIFLRFYKIEEWFFFNIDEEWYNFIVRKITVLHKPVLIGWEIPGGILVPPVMFYFGAIVMLLFNNNPIGFALIASFFGVLGVVLTYIVGKKIFTSSTVGIYAAVIYCFSFLINIYNRLSINLLFAPILSLLTYFSLLKIIENREKKYLVVLGLVFAFSTQEGSMISLIFLTIIVLFIYKVKFRVRELFIPISIFLTTFIPVIIFDLRHNFLVTNKLTNILKNTPIGKISLSGVLFPVILLLRFSARILFPSGPADINIQLLPCKNYLSLIEQSTPTIYSLFGLLIFIFFIHRIIVNKSGVGPKIILYHLLIVVLGLLLFSVIKPGYVHEWFFVVLIPAFCYFIAYLLTFFSENKFLKFITFVFIIIFVVINLSYYFSLTSLVGYKDKLEAVEYSANTVGNRGFEFDVLGNKCNGYGYRYLFTYVGKEPKTPYVDDLYVNWLYTQDIINKDIEYKVIIVPMIDLADEKMVRKYQSLKKSAIKFKRFNNLEVLIIQK